MKIHIGVLYTLMTLGDLIFAEGNEKNLKKLASAHNVFALDLNREFLEIFPENVFFSPLGIFSVLSMLYFGSRGNTAKELKDILQYEKTGLTSKSVLQTTRDFFDKLDNVEKSSNGTAMRTANAIVIDKTMNISTNYKKKIVKGYDASIQVVDFSNSTDEAAVEINDWVKKQTNGKITRLVDSLDPSTKMVLLNAVYFKGFWKFEFNKSDTAKDVFYNLGKESKKREIPFMKTTGEFRYEMFDKFGVLELPYKAENISMFIVLPNKLDGLEALIKNFTQQDFLSIEKHLELVNVIVQLPKFTLNFEIGDLPKRLRELGVEKIFDPREADFSSMASNKGLFVSEIIHKAVIEVNEEGTEAAGATGTVVGKSGAEHFKADHPFLFFIKEKSTDWILFIGSVISL
ncbi:leukocyte elastase inhibitor A [Trichonephila clavata]|uniref:Leukocyte elastase inhibitor A n=1 Tax=Trichonephila clavata TaxID=2740835 RepID=A0A8X6HU23_TRICU|nr:leukocyte elastase inhibitor A [Trichonephila clavata]